MCELALIQLSMAFAFLRVKSGSDGGSFIRIIGILLRLCDDATRT